MRRIMVRYRVRADRVAENEEAVRAVYAELAQTRPEGLRYATFRLADGATFVHVAEHGDPNPLQEVEAFRRFTAGVRDRCEDGPESSELTEIGSYRFFGE
jgi:hypothetical protein